MWLRVLQVALGAAALDTSTAATALDTTSVSVPVTPSTIRQVSVDLVQLWWDYGGVKGGSDSPGTPADGRKAMKDAIACGMKYYRFAATHFWPNEQQSTYFASPAAEAAYWSKMDVLFADAEALQVKLIPSLNWQLFLFPDLAGEPLRAMLTDANSKSSQLLQSYVTKFVSRYHNSSTIFAWELGNEYNLAIDLNYSAPGINMSGIAPPLGTPTHRSQADNISTTDLVIFQTRFAGWVRAADPQQRPISTGHATPRQGAWHLARSYHAPQRDWGPDTEAQFVETVAAQSAGCDLISYHYYGGSDNVRFGRTLGPPESAVLFPYLVEAAKSAGKQWYIGEFGTTQPTDRTFTINLLDQLAQVQHGPVLATMWTWEWPSGQPNISVVPGRPGDVAVIEKIKQVNKKLQSGAASASVSD